MAIFNKNLDTITRCYMRSELIMDIESDNVYYSEFLKYGYEDAWEKTLFCAIKNYDDIWLENHIISQKFLLEKYHKLKKNGGFIKTKTPQEKALQLAEAEFNRFYCRAICIRAIKEDKKVKIYRGKKILETSIKSKNMIGHVLSAQEILNELREEVSVNTVLGLPNETNTGLTICLI